MPAAATANDAPTARDMSHRSMAAVGAADRAGWLSLFAEDAVVEDPVGPSLFDPVGTGHRGKEAIGKFFDMAIAPNTSIGFDIRESHLCANEVANVGTISITLADGTVGRVSGVFVYKINDEGLICSLRAFWEQDAIDFSGA